MENAEQPPEDSPSDSDDDHVSLAALGSKPSAGLYLVCTPIGNLGDITHRAMQVLRFADVIACEDTRITAKLLRLLGLPHKTLVSYHEHNSSQATAPLIERLAAGQVVALVSDAGAPLISDPGFPLVEQARAQGLPVTALPGASAVVTALQVSGLPARRFLFAGFLASKSNQRRQELRELAEVPATLVFFESPNRVADSLVDMAAILGDRPAAVTRELTKLYEQVVPGTLCQLAAHYRDQTVKGEIVVVVGPPGAAAAASEMDVDQQLRDALAQGLRTKDAAAVVAAATGLPRKQVYARALLL